MTSDINATNINRNYPVAGKDNDSQGFRDNFSRIRDNLEIAANEITDLQQKAVLKRALENQELDNNFNGSLLKNAEFRGARETVVVLGTISGNIALSYSNGSVFSLSTSGNVTLEFTDATPEDTATEFLLRINVTNTAHALTLPSSVTIGVQAIRGYNPNSNQILFDKTGTYEFTFKTTDGGSNYSIADLNRNTTDGIVYWEDSEDLSNNAAASLEKTVSFFENNAPESATLVAGEEGQIKVFIKTNDPDEMVITVNEAGWKQSGSGTITFDEIGQSCTLLYINSKWYCTGNNGAVFS